MSAGVLRLWHAGRDASKNLGGPVGPREARAELLAQTACIKIGLFLVTLFLDATTGFHARFSLVVFVCFTLWSLVEIIVVKNDAAGNRMA